MELWLDYRLLFHPRLIYRHMYDFGALEGPFSSAWYCEVPKITPVFTPDNHRPLLGKTSRGFGRRRNVRPRRLVLALAAPGDICLPSLYFALKCSTSPIIWRSPV